MFKEILLLLSSLSMASPYEAYEMRRNEVLDIQEEIRKCDKIAREFGKFNLYNYRQIEKLTSDQRGGYIDSGLMIDIRTYFFNVRYDLDQTIRIIVSTKPDSKKCKAASDLAKERVIILTKDLVNPYTYDNSFYEPEMFLR